MEEANNPSIHFISFIPQKQKPKFFFLFHSINEEWIELKELKRYYNSK